MATYPDSNDTALTEMCEDLEVSRQEEIDLLEEIYIKELTLGSDERGHVNTVTLLLHPATGENAHLQYVCLTLEFLLPSEYPAVCPEMSIRNPRGLSDEHLSELHDGLHKLAEDRKGNPMLYELIEYVKESLTVSNVPIETCIICLEPFDEGQAFTKTACYHYFHTACMVRYIHHSLSEMEDRKKEARQHQHLSQTEAKDVACPICRVAIGYDPTLLENMPDSESLADLPPLSQDIRKMQAEMAKLFQQQKSKGGIIDLEAEKNKYLVTRDTVLIIPVEPAPSSSQSDPSPEDGVDEAPGKKNNRRRQKKPGKSSHDETRTKGPDKPALEEGKAAAMSKEEADLNKRRMMNQRRRNNQQYLRNQQRDVSKEESHKQNESRSVAVAQEEVHAKLEQLQLDKNGEDSCLGHESHTSKVTGAVDNFESDSSLPKNSDNQQKEKADLPKRQWDHRYEKGRFSSHRGRGRGRGSDKSWANPDRDSDRSDSRGSYYSQELNVGLEKDGQSVTTSQCLDSDRQKQSRSQGQSARRGRGAMDNHSADEKYHRAMPGNHNGSRHYHQRDYRQDGGYDQQRAPRHQKPHWDDYEGDYYSQRNPYTQHGRGYRGSYYQEKYNSSSDYQRSNGYKEDSDSYSDRSFAREKMGDHYRGKRQTGGFGRYSQSVAYSSDGSR